MRFCINNVMRPLEISIRPLEITNKKNLVILIPSDIPTIILEWIFNKCYQL